MSNIAFTVEPNRSRIEPDLESALLALLFAEHLSQGVVQNATVAEILKLDFCIESNHHLERFAVRRLSES